MNNSMVDTESGIDALLELKEHFDIFVVVDVLSFSTAVDIACSRDAEIIPYAFDGDVATLKQFAKNNKADLAKRRGDSGFTLSPSSLLTLPSGHTLVLPSPNGSTLCHTAKEKNVIVGCIRNASAIAKLLNQMNGKICILSAGEKWRNGGTRFAYEDLVGAGAIISELSHNKTYEAKMAEEIFQIEKANNFENIKNSKSAKELMARGFTYDIDLAFEYNCSTTIPVLKNGSLKKSV